MPQHSAHWDWRAPSTERKPDIAALRRRASLQCLAGAAGAAGFWFFGRETMASVVAGITGLSFLLAMFSPARGYTALQRALERFGHYLGLILSWLLLVPLFYLFFLPFGLLFRRGSKDPMQRRWSQGSESYWVKRDGKAPTLDDFRRQF